MRKVRFIALGAALAYFLDRENGKRRRKLAADRLVGVSRRHGKRLARASASRTQALKQRAAHRREAPKAQPDDVTLARKVESEIFRDPEVSKGKIDVNAEHGKVVLRGEAESAEMIDQLVAKARGVQGVRDVENLLHTPGQRAPMHK